MKTKLLILSVLALFFHATSWAYDFLVDGIYYSIVSSTDLTCKVTYRYSRSSSYSNKSYYTGSVTIPETVVYGNKTYTVTSIGTEAFNYCSNMTEVRIPTTVTYIDDYAFYYCSGLTEITIPRTVTSIGDHAFYGCTGLTNVTIPDGVEDINSYTFYGCTALKNVTIPESITSISSYAFYGCSKLEEINLPNSVTSIASYAFYNCNGLTELTIPSSVTEIGNQAFQSCSNLRTVTFEDCDEALTMTTSSSYTPFTDCPIETVYLGRNISYNGTYSPFRGNTTLSSLTMGDNVTEIYTYEFYGCTGLTELVIPNSVTTIGTYAFNGCTGLKDITIGSGATSIGSYTFNGCKPDEMYFYARLDDYYLVFTGMTCGTLYAYEDQVDAIKAEYSGTVCPLEDVYSLSEEGTYPRSIVLRANANERLMTDGVSLKSVKVGNTEITAGADGLYVAKDLLPETSYTCTLSFMYGSQERTDEIAVQTDDFWNNAEVQEITPTTASVKIELKEDPYSSQPDEYGLLLGDYTYFAADTEGNATATGLQANTEHSFDLYAKYGSIVMRGETITITTIEHTPPTVVTAEAAAITATSATLKGTVTAGTEEMTECGFEYWETDGEAKTVTTTEEEMVVTLEDLTPGTTYHYHAYATTESGTVYGETLTFTTPVIPPTVKTEDATGITYKSAMLNGTVTAGSEEILEQGFEYRLATAQTSDVTTVTGTGEEMYVTITGLAQNTTYIFCAYAKTDSKTTYGEDKVFTTSVIVAPTVETLEATDITYYTATLNGAATAGSDELLEQGFEYWETDDDVHALTVEGESMSVTLTDLTPGTTYHYRSYAITENGCTYGGTRTFTTPVVPPTVETLEATDITFNSVTLNGAIEAGSEEIMEQGFEYWMADGEVQTVTATEKITAVTVVGLASSTTYAFRTYATTASGTTYGEEMTFTTDEYVYPTVLTYEATDITYYTATLHGTVTAGSEEIKEQGFEYWETDGEMLTVTAEGESISVTLIDLMPGTTYHYRTYVVIDSGTVYGETLCLTTPVVPPTVETLEATDITYNSATLNSATEAGSEEITEQGFEYWLADGEVQTVKSSEAITAVTVAGLSSSATYTFRAYVTTASGTIYGEEMTFTTDEYVAQIAETKDATNITYTAATLNGTVTAGSEEITEQGFEYWETDGEILTVTAEGESMSVTVIGLTPGTTYYYRTYATTESGVVYGETTRFETTDGELLDEVFDNIESTRKGIEDAWNFVLENCADVADDFKDSFNALSEELEAIADYIEDTYNSGELTEEMLKAAIDRLATIGQEMEELLISANQTENNYLYAVADEIKEVQGTLNEAWETISTDCTDVAGDFKVTYESLSAELDELLQSTDEAYSQGGLTIAMVEETRSSLETIKRKIEEMLADAKAEQKTVGIEGLRSDYGDDVRIYNLAGSRVHNLERGNVYIIRYSDGTAKKVLVK